MAGSTKGPAGIHKKLRLPVRAPPELLLSCSPEVPASPTPPPSPPLRARLPRRALLKLLEQVTPEEKFLRQIPAGTTECHVVYPSALPEKLVRRRLHLLATECVEGHRKWLFWSWAALPFSVATVVRGGGTGGILSHGRQDLLPEGEGA